MCVVYHTIYDLITKSCMLCIFRYTKFNNKIVCGASHDIYFNKKIVCVVYPTVYSSVTKLCVVYLTVYIV